MSIKSFWEGNSPRQHMSEKLDTLVPDTGSVAKPRTNRKLEKYRKASNCYYDLYNNGLHNRCQEFTKIIGLRGSDIRRRCGISGNNSINSDVEKVMTIIVEEAYCEQFGE